MAKFSLKGMDTKKQTFLIAGIVVGVLWLFFVFFMVHYYWVVQNPDPWSTQSTLSLALEHMANHPFEIFPFPVIALGMSIVWTLLFGLFVMMYVMRMHNMRHENKDTVAGTEKFMTPKELREFHRINNEPMGQPVMDSYRNMILSNNVGITMRSQSENKEVKCKYNLNSLVIGGSGVGKSFRVVGPNIMQRNASYVITDPSGGLYHKYGAFLEYFGYRVKVFNTDRMNESNHYNPFRYIHSDKDIEILVTMIITNTTSPESGKGDQFWEKCETALFCALIGYLYHYGEAEEQNFSNVMRLIRAANVDENDSSMESPLDKMFAYVKKADPDSFTMTQYETFRLGAGKTLKSILISAAVRLQAFDLDTVRDLTDTDDIHLDTIADEKTALFIIIPTGEKTFNFLAGLMYSQLFNQLYRYCENTSKFSQCIIDTTDKSVAPDEGDVIRVFHAENKKDMERARKEAQEWLELIQEGRVEKIDSMSVKDESDEEDESGNKKHKLLDFWAIKNARGEMVGYRGTEKLALEALEMMKHAAIIPNSKRPFNKGECCPVHVSFLLDEFANTGKIPSFVEKISTIRKYEISVMIILQGIAQIKNLFEKDWTTIAANCDTLVYLGGGADTDTTEWLNKLLGKKTVRAMNESYSKGGGSVSLQSQGIELYSMAQLRTMPNGKCMVLPRGQHAVFDDMFDTPNHKDWKLAGSMPNYTFSAYRQAVIRRGFGEDDAMSGGLEGIDDISDHGAVPPEANDDKEVREARNHEAQTTANEVRSNFDELTESPAVSDITIIDPIEDVEKAADALGLTESAQEAPQESASASEQLVDNEVLEFSFGDDMEFDFSEASMASG